MTSKEYIISKLERFIKNFPHARVRYEHDADIDTHFVEILPNDLYYLNEDYMDWEEHMFDDFIEMFPGESIGFITDDAIVGLENVDYEFYGKLFDVVYTTSNDIVSVNEELLEIRSSTTSDSTVVNDCFSEMDKSVHVEDIFGYSYIKFNDKSLLAA